MTEEIVSAVVKKLADLLSHVAQSLRGVEDKIDEVKLQLGQMQGFLGDAESKKKTGDMRMKGWVHDVRNVTYETEDAIDTFLVEANYRSLGLIANRLFAHRTLGEKISKIQTKLLIISEGRTTFGIQDLSGDRAGPSESHLQKQPSLKRRVILDVDSIKIIGLDAEKRDIINLLLHQTSSQSRHVVSIVGPGGLGKTTLALMVYNSPIVKNHFDPCIWITVTQDFNLLGVLKKIHKKLANETELKRVLGELKELQQEDQIVFLLGEVSALLKEKKYLIVLDDVWAENVFTQLETGLVDIGNGSRVLMTTRNLNVANCADPSGVYFLRFLSEGESFNLFLKKAFPSSDSLPECPDELLDLTRKLVKRCGGLPLTLTVLGGLLSSKTPTYEEWSRVLNRLDWYTVDGGECMKILTTSYDDLPYILKSCFRYLACFPEDYKIEAERLMQMWIAEGLVDVKKEGEFEDFAEDYLEELVQRCLVQVVERSPNGAIKSIRVHDLLREVALGEAKENDFLLIWKDENADRDDVSMTRRVAFHNEINPRHLTKIKMPNLRTFINFGMGSFVDRGIGFLLLRVLELRGTFIMDLPNDLKNMIHLRYLGLSTRAIVIVWCFCLRTRVTVIPSWIDHLQNLQTFDIRGSDVKELPKSLWKITSLRHVRSSAHYQLVGPPSTANLVNLRSLGWFKVPKSWKKSLPNYLLGIRKLQLLCCDENDDMLIHDLISELNNLVSMGLENLGPPRGMIDFSTSSTDTIVCTDRGFPRLQSLELICVKNIKKWKVEYGALSVLKYLCIIRCSDLQALPDLQYVTTLQELKIDSRLKSKIENESGEEWEKVKHIPTITELM
ncbi:putative disease resistance RPP13-like protein 3 [Carex rostrata]